MALPTSKRQGDLPEEGVMESMSKPSDILELQPGEQELKRIKGDFWGTRAAGAQVPGTYIFTDRRILFRGNGLVEAMRVVFSLPSSAIVSMEPYNVSLFIPTGIRVNTQDGTVYRVSVLKRKEIMAFIEEQRQKQG